MFILICFEHRHEFLYLRQRRREIIEFGGTADLFKIIFYRFLADAPGDRPT